jgi:Family of unknown function (DUF6314)
MAAARDLGADRYRAAVSSAVSNRRQYRAGHPPSSPETAGQAFAGGTVDFLHGDWNVVRTISDHRTGQAGLFRGQASFRPYAAGLAHGTGLADVHQPADPEGRVLAYYEHGELQFGGYRGPASRSLLYRDPGDGSADIRFADGREFYRLDLRAGTWSAEHPCRADQYLVTVTRLGPDSFTEAWRVAGPGMDYELSTTYTRVGCDVEAGGPA